MGTFRNILIVTVPLRGGEVRLVAERLSGAMDGYPGVVRLRGEAGTAQRLPGAGAALGVHRFLEDSPAPMPGRFRIIRAGVTPTDVWMGGAPHGPPARRGEAGALLGPAPARLV